ncbi:Na+/H+ antiporter subunit G [Sporosarcina sp. P37]|uniref:monovalent cation/H(+) antiporter subunit G n=1 Tax=unclassified Sporosarcina TaxID=2647733 RepID=UPI000A17D806|nr:MULTISPECIES: monovalent cation/H(+) antiporter subunit G [unclassified Sporosarcina]ARK24004.1 Na+/H+ antiporter subunit G [Sporosarcina sp. P37]PID17198.1 Na+/H+ antiporter subunit G [Sporosarcina sp. P35]
MDLIADSIIILLVTVGIMFTIVTVIGILRLPDVYTRAHAASKSATLGVMSLLLGVFFNFWWNEGHFSIQLLLGIVFLFITSPIGGHLMTRAAYMSGVQPTKLTVGDDLKKAIKKKREEIEKTTQED